MKPKELNTTPGTPIPVKHSIANAPLAATDPLPQSQVEATLAEHGKRYGNFSDNSAVFVAIMTVFCGKTNWEESPPEVKHALSNIATKLARLLTGDPLYYDNWRDIAGYATLMDRICQGEDK